jgi:hypothetical protein
MNALNVIMKISIKGELTNFDRDWVMLHDTGYDLTTVFPPMCNGTYYH